MTARRSAARFGLLTALGLLSVAGVVTVPATPAGAHPTGAPFQTHQYQGLTFTPDRVRVAVAVHTAEVVTRQERRAVDADRDGAVTAAERRRYARAACAGLAAGFAVEVDGERLLWAVTPGGYGYERGSPGLPTARLTCDLAAPAGLSAPATVTIANHHRPDDTGYREVTAVGDGVRLLDSRLPQHSVSDQLRAIPPADAYVVNVRTATVRVEPGPAGQVEPQPAVAGAPSSTAPADRGGPLAAGTTWAERRLEAFAGGRLTPPLAVLAVLTAVLLGAGHAALPGHGKTVLAAYLAGRRGRPRDAVAVGATVTVSHTGAVLLVGVLISTSAAFAADRMLGYLGVISGLLVVAVGIGMLVAVARGRTSHPHVHGHAHDTGHARDPGHDHGHDHDHGHGHHHGRRTGRLGLAGIGVAGGLVPSPTALVVLLASIGMGRAIFGVLLVLAYGLGMAGTLTAAGLLLLAVRRRVSLAERRSVRLLARLGAAAPAAWPLITSALVLVVGAGLTLRAAAVLA
jgi:ABC-type nickel/cobalt efflux system permease component RcnA